MDTWLRRWASRNAPQSPVSGLDSKGYISIPKDSIKGITSESGEPDGQREDDTNMKNPCSDCEYKDDDIAGMYRDWETDRKSTRLNSSHSAKSRMPSSA